MTTKSLEIILPCYNEAKSLANIVDKTIRLAKKHGLSKQTFKLTIVENGSTDESKQILDKMLENRELKEWMKVCTIHKNQGYGFGIHTGLLEATGDILSWTHADDQCDIEDVFRCFEYYNKHHQGSNKLLVKGSRLNRELSNRIISNGFALLCRLILKTTFTEINAQPKLFSKEAIREINAPPNDFCYDLYVLYKLTRRGYKVLEIPVSFHKRAFGTSKWAYSLKSRLVTIAKFIKYIWHLKKHDDI